MSTETASKIKMFLINNNINKRINIMGGEFFCNPDWKEIIEGEVIRQLDKSNNNHIGYFHHDKI